MSKNLTISDVCKATGMSRSAVYRKINKGSSREELIGDWKDNQLKPDPDFEAEPPRSNIDPDDKAALTWCKAVLWAAENMNEADMTLEKAGSKLRFSMWQSSEKFPKELLIQLVPKALQILDRNKDDGSSAESVVKEQKSIEKLRELLAGAVEEAKLITVQDY